MLQLLQMWAIMEVLGIIFLPLTITVFHNLPDRGWAFSKAIGLSVLAFSVWLPLMLFQFLPFSALFILGVLLFLVALNLLGWWAVRKTIAELLNAHYLYIVCVELIFLGMVFLLGWLRSAGPDLSSFEMYMDEGFLSAIMRSPHFPPNDMWYAGQSINYYYYAHYNIALLAKLLGQSPSVAFNTGISMFFGLTAVSLLGVTANIVAWAQHQRNQRRKDAGRWSTRPQRVLPSLTGAIPYAILSILLGEVLGNLAATQTWWQSHGSSLPYYYWFNTTRVITNTINEFPAFSFLLSCFHAHVLALAFTMVGLGLAFNIFLEYKGQGLQAFGRGWRMPLTLGMTALLLGSLYTMNGWDYPTYLGLALICLILQQWMAHDSRLSWDLALDLFTACAAVGALSFFLFAPFYLNFVSPAQGIGLVDSAQRTVLANEVLIYGIFAFIFFSFLLSSFFRPRAFAQLAARLPVLPFSRTFDPPVSQDSEESLQDNAGEPGQVEETTVHVPLSPLLSPVAQEKAGPAALEILPELAPADVNGNARDEEDVRIEDLEEQSEDQGIGERPTEDATQPVAPGPELSGFSAMRLRDVRVIGFLITLAVGIVCLFVLKNSLTFVVTGGLAAMGSILTLYHLRERERSFVLLLGSTACALVAICEIIYLRDVFGGQYERMNTVFKFYFQAWALLSIVGGAGVYFVLDSLRPVGQSLTSSRWTSITSRALWSAALLFFLLMGAVYPVTAPKQRYEGFTPDTSLDGLDFMKSTSPGDYDAIRWINAHIQGDPVIVEAPGGEYSLYGRVSVFTGLPSPINWQGHEWQWRVNWVNKGLNGVDFFRRVTDVNQIYTDKSSQDVLNLMARYNAQYLYVGPLEQQTYVASGVDLQRFGAFMRIIYQYNGVTIYQVP